MYETTGALIISTPSTLLVLVVLPLLWSMGVATAGTRPSLAIRIAVAGAAGTLGWACLLAGRLAGLPRGHVLGEHVASLLRVGQLDLTIDLLVDPLAAVGAVLVSVVTLASVLHEVWSGRAGRRLAWIGVLGAGAVLVTIADGIAPLAIGLGVTGAGGFAVARDGRRPALVTTVAADALAVLALFLLFWSLGGSFGGGGGYEPEPLARYVLVASPGGGGDAKPSLAMTTHPGALVWVDDGPPLPGEPLRAPFETPIEPSVYTFHIQPGAATAEVVVPHVAIAAGHAYTLAPSGPTATLRTLLDQVAVPRPTIYGTPMDARALLATRSILGLRSTVIIAVLLVLALAGRLLALASRRGARPLALVIEAIVPSILALRLARIFDPAAADGAAVALGGALLACVLAGHAAASDDRSQAARSALGSGAAMVIAAAGIGEIAGGLSLEVAVVLAGTAALASIVAPRDVRWLGVACAAAVGLLPMAGASSGIAAILARALAPTATWRGLGLVVAAGVVLGTTLSTIALFRMHDAIIATPASGRGTRGQGAITVVLAATALASGVVLGAGTSPFGGRVVPLSSRILGSDAASARGDAWVALGLGLVAAAAGLFVARHAPVRRAPFAFAARPARVLAGMARAVGGATWFLSRGAVVVDRDVVEDIGRAAGAAVLAASRAVTRGDRLVEDRLVGRSVAWLSEAVTSRLGLDHPRAAARVATAALVVMVALLGLVVLSSVLLA